jgi:O-antigen/teichoic acid export membrane protein
VGYRIALTPQAMAAPMPGYLSMGEEGECALVSVESNLECDADETLEFSNLRSTYLSTSVTLVLCLGCSLVSGVLSARLLAPTGRGELAVLSYYPSLIASILPLGLPMVLSLRMSSRQQSGAKAATAGFWGIASLGVLGCAIAAFLVPYYLPADKQYLTGAVRIMCLLGLPMVLSPALYAIERALHFFAWVNGIQLLNSAATIVILGAIWLIHRATPLFIGICLMGLQGILVILHLWRIEKRYFFTPISFAYSCGLFWHGLRFFLPAAGAIAYGLADRAILIRSCGVVEIGWYVIAFSVAYPLSLLAETFAQLGFIEVASSGDPKELIVHRLQVLRIVIIVSASLVACLIGHVIRLAFGASFAGAVAPAYILLGAMAFRSHSRALESMLRATDHAWPGTASSCVSLAVLAAGAITGHVTGARSLAIILVIADAIGFTILVASASAILKTPPIRFIGVPMAVIVSLHKQLRVSFREAARRFAHSG